MDIGRRTKNPEEEEEESNTPNFKHQLHYKKTLKNRPSGQVHLQYSILFYVECIKNTRLKRALLRCCCFSLFSTALAAMSAILSFNDADCCRRRNFFVPLLHILQYFCSSLSPTVKINEEVGSVAFVAQRKLQLLSFRKTKKIRICKLVTVRFGWLRLVLLRRTTMRKKTRCTFCSNSAYHNTENPFNKWNTVIGLKTRCRCLGMDTYYIFVLLYSAI